MNDHSHYRTWAGFYLLGTLRSNERAEFEVHLADCYRCQREIIDMAPLPGLLSQSSETTAGSEPLPSRVAEGAIGEIRRHRRDLDTRNRQWRLITIGLAVSTAMLLIVAVWPRGGEVPVSTLPDSILSVEGAATGEIALTSKLWGLAITAELADLPERATYELWVVTADGERQRAATWGPTPPRKATLTAASAIDYGSVVAIEVVSGPDNEVIAVAHQVD